MNARKDDSKPKQTAETASEDLRQPAAPAASSGPAKKASAPRMTRVRLIKKHIHAGISHAENEIIEVFETVADYLEKHGIGKRVNTADQDPDKQA